MRDDQPIVLKGTIVRCDHGPSALGLVCDYTIGHGGSVAYYHMRHCLGGIVSRYHSSLTVATGQEVLDFWNYRKQYNMPEITIDDVPQSPEGHAAWELEQRRLAAKTRELELNRRESEAFRTLERMAGYVQNSTDMIVAFFQDDATKSWIVKVAPSYEKFIGCTLMGRGQSLIEAIDHFKTNHPNHFDD